MAKSDTLTKLRVGLAENAYSICIGRGLLTRFELIRKAVRSCQVMVITNETVAPLYLETLKQAFIDLQCDCIVLKDGEQYKNQQSLESIYHGLIEHGHHRDTTLVALGGGVIGDITGFAASCYQRGVDFIQIPTTLLAQVDASVGGKTAINFGKAKNMIGSFYQPKAVFIDVDVLKTLPEREFKAGLAEVIKYGLIGDADFFNWLESRLPHFDNKSTAHLIQTVSYCCKIKADIVQKDEREKGIRAYLNLGHTFAHALEALSEYKRWLHGEAVAIGLVCAATMSYKLGKLSLDSVNRIEAVIAQIGLPTHIPADIDCDMLIELMDKDKKVLANKKHFILLREIGDCYITNDVDDDLIKETLLSRQE